jgi:hypothetical protein
VLNVGDTWALVRRGRRIADLVITGADWPWANAVVHRRPGSEAVEDLFRTQLAALDLIDTDVDTWDAADDAVRTHVELLTPDGIRVPEFLLHIDGDSAWWRWHDKPFDD